jgi:hypothetical protein
MLVLTAAELESICLLENRIEYKAIKRVAQSFSFSILPNGFLPVFDVGVKVTVEGVCGCHDEINLNIFEEVRRQSVESDPRKRKISTCFSTLQLTCRLA